MAEAEAASLAAAQADIQANIDMGIAAGAAASSTDVAITAAAACPANIGRPSNVRNIFGPTGDTPTTPD